MQDIKSKLIFTGYFFTYFLGVIVLLPPEFFYIKIVFISTGLLIIVISEEKLVIRPSSIILLLLLLIWLVSGLLSPLKYKVLLCHYYFFIFLLSILSLDQKKILKMSAWSLFLISTVGLLQATSIIPAPVDNYGHKDFSSLMGLSNYVAHFVGPLLIPFIWYAIKEKRKFWIVASFLTVLYIILIKNRTLLFALWGSTLFIFLTCKKKRLKLILLTLYILISAGLLFTKPVKRLYTLRDYSARFRYYTYLDTLKLIKDHLLGITGKFQETFPEYISYNLDKQLYTTHSFVNNPHSEPLYWGADFGIPGIIFYLFIWLQVLKKFFHAKSNPLTISLITALLQSLFDFNFHTPAGALIFFSLYFASVETKIKFLKRYFKIAVVTFVILCVIVAAILSYSEFMFRTGKFFLNEGKRDIALQYFKKSLNIWPYNWNALTLEGLIYKKIGLNDLAKYKLSLSIRYNPTNVTAMKHLGIIYAKEGETDKTFNIWLKAMRYSPYQRVKIAKKLINLLIRNDKIEKLEKLLKKYPELLEKEPELRYYLQK